MGGGGGGGSQSTVVDKNLLPDYAQYHVQQYLGRSGTLSLEAYATYAGATYAAQNQDEIDGITALATRGRNGHTIIAKAEVLLRDTLDGAKLNVNPKMDESYLRRAEAVLQELEEETLPRLAHEFNMTGNYGSHAHNLAQAKAAENVMAKLSEVGIDVYYGDYLSERAHMGKALGVGVPYGSMDVGDIDLLRQAGIYMREYTQGAYHDAFKKFKDEQEAQTRRLEILGNAIRSLVGAHSTKTEPVYRPSSLQQAAGIALAGLGAVASIYKAYSAPKSSPYSAANDSTGTGQGAQAPAQPS